MAQDNYSRFEDSTNEADTEFDTIINDGIGRKTYRIVESYIPGKPKNVYSKLCLIVGSLILIPTIILMLVISGFGFGKTETSIDTGSVDIGLVTSLVPREMVLYDGIKFWTFNPGSTRLRLLHDAAENVEAFDVYVNDTIIWSVDNKFSILSLSDDESNAIRPNFFLDDGKLKIQGMAVDFISENLYVVDGTSGNLIVINVVTKHYALVLSDLENPTDVVLDPSEGLMFILQSEKSILKGSMDGKLHSKIVMDKITAITLDTKAKRIYWVNDYYNIISSNYDGNDHEFTLVDFQNSITSLAILDNHLFWLWNDQESADTTLWSCKIDYGTCENHKGHEIDTGRNLKSIRSCFDQGRSSSTASVHPCRLNNGGCQHLCLVGPNNKRNCACDLGWHLNQDRKTCSLVSEFLLYTLDNSVRGRTLNLTKAGSTAVIWPTSFSAELVLKSLVHFDYDTKNDDFYFSDDEHIYQMKLRSRSNQTLVLHRENYLLLDVAFDWASGNLYYFEHATVPKTDSLMVINVHRENTMQKTLGEFPSRLEWPYSMENKRTVALHPASGNFFFASLQSSRYSYFDGAYYVNRMATNGTSLTPPFADVQLTRPVALAIDYERNRLYTFISTGLSMQIRHANFDGSDEQFFHPQLDVFRKYRSFFVHKQWVYVSDSLSVWRFHKDTGNAPIRIMLVSEQSFSFLMRVDVKIASLQLESTGHDSCAGNNGGCQQFCYSGPQLSCGCENNKTLINDKICV